MHFKSKTLTCAAIILAGTIAASAASKKDKNTQPYNGLRNQVTAPQPPVSFDDPALTGGGSLGYNQNIYNDSW